MERSALCWPYEVQRLSDLLRRAPGCWVWGPRIWPAQLHNRGTPPGPSLKTLSITREKDGTEPPQPSLGVPTNGLAPEMSWQ